MSIWSPGLGILRPTDFFETERKPALLPRRGWQLPRPPDGLFEINHQSPQAKGLIGWWPTLDWVGQYSISDRVSRYGNGTAGGSNGVALAMDPAMGIGTDFLNVSSGSSNNALFNVPSPGVMIQGSISVWAKIDNTPTGSFNHVFACQNVDSDGRIYLSVSENGWEIRLGNTAGSVDRGENNIGELYHMVIVWNNGVGYMYQNSIEVGGAYNYTGNAGSDTGATAWGSFSETQFGYDGKLWDMRIYDRALSPVDVAQLYSPTTRWELYQPIHRKIWYLTPTEQIIRPTTDVVDGQWTNEEQTAVDLYDSIDEINLDTTDHIHSEKGPNKSAVVIGLGTASDPEISSGHKIRYAYNKEETGVVNLTVELREGYVSESSLGALRASWYHDNVSADVTKAEQLLSDAEADSITDYSDLFVRFVASESKGELALRGALNLPRPPSEPFVLNIQSPQAKGLVGWWPTLEANRNVLRDYSGYGNHIPADGAFTQIDVVPELGQAMYSELDSDHDFVGPVTDILDFSTDKPFTFSVWFNTTDYPEGYDAYGLAMYGDNDDSNCSWEAVIGNENGYPYPAFRVIDTGEILNQVIISGLAGLVVAGTWHLFHGWHDPIASVIGISIDGNRWSNTDPHTDGIYPSTGNLRLGIFTFSNGFNGYLADFRIYNRVLSPTERYAQWLQATRWDLYKTYSRSVQVLPVRYA